MISARRPLTFLLVCAATLTAAAGLASTASANFYPLAPSDEILRQFMYGHPKPEYAYKGPRTEVGDSGTSVDEYQCPGTQHVSDWTAFPDDLASVNNTLGISSSSTASYHASEPGSRFSVRTTNFSGNTAEVRVIAVCSDDPGTWRYNQFSVGSYWDHWVRSLEASKPDYRQLVIDAFFFDVNARPRAATPRSVPARATALGNRRFALHNGTNTLSVQFRHGSANKDTLAGRRPPAIYLKTSPAKADCRSQRMYMNVTDGDGSLLLKLTCKGLKKGSTARVTIKKPIRRTFRLGKGDGVIRLHLDKPLGTVDPFIYITKHPTDTPCRSTSRRIRRMGRTFELRVGAHCDDVAPGSTGRLYVGGLLAP